MEDLLLAESRLENINAVEPILSALRTVAHGTWQKAMIRSAAVQSYKQRIERMTSALLASFLEGGTGKPLELPGPQVLLLAMGSERGLCGQFNPVMLDALTKTMKEQRELGRRVHIWALGSRFIRQLGRERISLERTQAFGAGSLPHFEVAHDLAKDALAAFERGDVDGVYVLYNTNTRAGRLQTQHVRLIPPVLDPSSDGRKPRSSWPTPIIETEPIRLLGKLVAHSTAVKLYEALIASTAAENATRFFLMEDATQNVEGLMEELEGLVQLNRQQQITQEMSELAAGSGLLKMD